MKISKACLYSPVKDRELLSKVGFYRDDLLALKINAESTTSTNSLTDILKLRPNLLVGYFYSKSLIAVLLGRILGSRVILTGGADQISKKIHKTPRIYINYLLAFLCILFSHKILLSCTDDLINFKKLCFKIKFLEEKLHLSWHVVTPSPKNNQIRKTGFNAFTLCWMGSIGNVKRKGVDKSIKFIYLLRKIGIDAKLHIAGADGPGRSYLDKIIKELNLSDAVRIIGQISDDEKNNRFASDNVYLQLSEYEGFGVAAAEAFFSGMIVIHSNNGGLADIISNKGIIVDCGKINELDEKWCKSFMKSFEIFQIPRDYLEKNIKNFSIKSRSISFYEA